MNGPPVCGRAHAGLAAPLGRAARRPPVIARPVACAPAPTRERGVTW